MSEGDDSSGRQGILREIKNPLVFYALALLIVEGALAAVLATGNLAEAHVFASTITMAALFFVVVAAVTVLTYVKPRHLMAEFEKKVLSEAKNVALKEARGVSESLVKTELFGLFRTLRARLNDFEDEKKIGESQSTSSEERLEQNPLLVYVKPVCEQVRGNDRMTEIMGPELLDKITELASGYDSSRGGEMTVRETREKLDEIIKSLPK